MHEIKVAEVSGLRSKRTFSSFYAAEAGDLRYFMVLVSLKELYLLTLQLAEQHVGEA